MSRTSSVTSSESRTRHEELPRAAGDATSPRLVEPPAAPNRPKTGPPLGELLVERHALTEDQLRDAIAQQQHLRKRLGEVLILLGYASPDVVLEGLSAQLGVPPTRVNAYTVTPEAVKCLPEKVARRFQAVPLVKVGTSLVVATANPRDLKALDDLRFAAGCAIQAMVALESEIQAAIDECYGSPFGLREDGQDHGFVVVDLPGPQLDLQDEAAQKNATSLVNRIIARAMADRASDIHLEPTRHHLRVRFRVDGMFHDVATLLLAVAPAVIARLKVLAGMDIAISRVPQDGRFSATINARGLDVRMSTYPTIWGEKAVLRLLDRSNLQLSVDRLMSGATRDRFRSLIGKPEGIILVTGPTGSGKTSTLYAAVAELAEQGRNVTTIEDPVEYWLPGVNQGQTNPKAGFTFARGLRAMLRQDPDVIMVGEIRDQETLTTAVEASLTGHLVLSTLHTNGSVATLTRLLEMGVEPHVMSSAVSAVLAQRLVRRLCAACRQPAPVPAAQRDLFGASMPDTVWRAEGCESCRGLGYHGRVGIYELLVLDADLRRALTARASEDELLALARRRGLVTLADQALALVRDGTTTLDEVTRVLHDLQPVGIPPVVAS